MSIPVLPQDQILPLLQALPAWGDLTTIVFSAGCVFEFKGPFPPGQEGDDYYNLDGPVPGLQGHLRLAAMAQVRFQERPHRGRESCAFVFEDAQGRTVFKVFLGREADGAIIASQLQSFQRIRDSRLVATA